MGAVGSWGPMTPLRERFIKELTLRGMSPRTVECYIAAIYSLARYYRLAPDQVTDAQLQDYLLHLRGERKLSPSTLNQHVSALRTFYQLVLQRPLTQLQAAIPRVRRQIRRPQIFSRAELEKLFTIGCPQPRSRAFLMTVYGAGLRLSEACHLRVENLESARAQIRVLLGKGGKDRYTLLPPRLLEELRSYWRLYRPKTWLFPSRMRPDQPIVDVTDKVTGPKGRRSAGAGGGDSESVTLFAPATFFKAYISSRSLLLHLSVSVTNVLKPDSKILPHP